MKSTLLKSLSYKNFYVISGPNPIEAPRLLGVLPGFKVGSAHSKSHMTPLSGGSTNRYIFLISLSLTPSEAGKPPWQTITFLLNTYDKGSAQNN